MSTETRRRTIGRETRPHSPASTGQPWWTAILLALFAGALLYLAFPPVGLDGLAWVALVPLVLGALRSRPAGAFALGAIAGLVWFGGILDWVRLFGEPPFNTVLWLLAAGFEALFVGLFALLTRLILAPRAGFGFVFGVPALWTAVEWLRCAGPWGFPWGVLGETQVRHATLIQCADVTGVWGLTFLVALVNGNLVGWWIRRRLALGAWRLARGTAPGAVARCRSRQSAPPPPSALSSGLLLGALIYGAFLPSQAPSAKRSHSAALLRVAVVQGNVEWAENSQQGRVRELFGAYGKLTRQVLAPAPGKSERGPDLVLWPETVVPGDPRRDPELREALAALARQGQCALLVGTPHFDGQNHPKNAAVLVGPEGGIIGWYEKVHLVPFGEYIPMRGWLPFLNRFPSVTDQYPGTGYCPVVMERHSTRVGTMICFESAFPGISRTFVRQGAQILAVLTSDASFGRTSAAEHHAVKAVFRAIETRRWLVQAATTGVSLAVDPWGRVHRRLGMFEAGTFTVDAALNDAVTPYVRYGDWLVALCGLGVLALATARAKERRREGEGT